MPHEPGKLLITGGAQRQLVGAAAQHNRWGAYGKALIIELDTNTGEARCLYEYETPEAYQDEKIPSIVFKCATITKDRMYLCTETEVLILRWPDCSVIQHISHPCFNDVHHVCPIRDYIYVASAGLDMVIVLDNNGECVDYLPVIDEKPFERFAPNEDYRKRSTKPHKIHPNYVFRLDGEPWVVRCNLKDAVCLNDHSKRIDVRIEKIHDGNVEGNSVWFTTVNGHLVKVDTTTYGVIQDYDLNQSLMTRSPLGWCRGLYHVGDMAYVGFSRLRETPLKQNLRWIASFGHYKQFLPTRVSLFDLKRMTLLRDYNLEGVNLSAVFSIIPVPGS